MAKLFNIEWLLNLVGMPNLLAVPWLRAAGTDGSHTKFSILNLVLNLIV
eukprot:SAG31_NODE_140_length_22731_cov_10.941410_14_plen_49_part_00